jgi:hypothetical protein
VGAGPERHVRLSVRRGLRALVEHGALHDDVPALAASRSVHASVSSQDRGRTARRRRGRLDETLRRMSADEDGRAEAWDLSGEVGDPRTEAFAAAYARLITARVAPVLRDPREVARLFAGVRASGSYRIGSAVGGVVRVVRRRSSS